MYNSPMELKSSSPGRNPDKIEKKLPPGSRWIFSKKGTALFSPDFLSYGQEYRDLSQATKSAQRLANGIQEEFMEVGWNFTSVIEMPTERNDDSTMFSVVKNIATIGSRKTPKGELIAIVFTNPSKPDIKNITEYVPDFIKKKWKEEIAFSFGTDGWDLPPKPCEGFLEGTTFSLSSPANPHGLEITYNSLPDKNFLWRKQGPFFQKGVVIVSGYLENIE